MLGFGLKLLTQLVKVKLLLAKTQGLTVSLENTEMACVGDEKCLRAQGPRRGVLSADILSKPAI